MKDTLHIDEFVRLLRRRKYSRNTILAYQSCVKKVFHFFGIKNPAALKGKRLRAKVGEYVRKNHLSLSKQKQVIGSMRFYYELLFDEHIDVRNLYVLNSRTVLPEILTSQQVHQLIVEQEDLRSKALICLAYGTGCTSSELCRLQLSDLDFRKQMVHVRSIKKYENRYLLMPRKMCQLLRDYIREQQPRKFLFPGKNDAQITKRNMQYITTRAGEAAGLKKEVTLSMIRHSYATHLAEKGTDARVIMELLGLKNVGSVSAYMKLAKGKVRKVSNPLDDMDY